MGVPQRMSSSDTPWLHMDRPDNLMVVNCVFWFDQPLDWDRLAAAFADRLVSAYPRFAQRAVDPPVTLGLIAPIWRDADDLDVQDHFRRFTLPAPGGDAELHAYVSAQADVPLDPARPLWEAHLIDGFRGDGDGPDCAILLRTDHAVADGTALVQALLTLVDTPGTGGHPDQLSRPATAQPASSLVSRALGAAHQLGPRRAMAHRLGFGRTDDPSPLRGRLSGRKRLSWSRAVPMGRLPAVVEKQALNLFTGRAGAVITNSAGPREEVRLVGFRCAVSPPGCPRRGRSGWACRSAAARGSCCSA